MFDEKTADELKVFAATEPKQFVREVLNYLDVGTDCDELESMKMKNALHHFTMPCVHSEGGGEGEGEYVERVFAVKDGDEALVYFRITGFYSSYNGTDWDDGFSIVEPYQKTITLYRDK